MSLQVDIQSDSAEPVPDESEIRRWITAAAATQATSKHLEISVRMVGTDEMTTLNETYRGKTGPTNVLSFPATLPDELHHPLLGDIVICAPVVVAEAKQQGKDLEAHWAHMAVHGTLHLFGYDHLEEEEASNMEALESTILSSLNYSCPYEETASKEYTS
ncbi:MAG: putative rRNA maturation factor [Halioglobus sp.]|jgi:probable rRNA maturation factor